MDVKRVKMDKGSLFGHLDVYPPDPIFHVKDAYLADESPSKVNLGIGGEVVYIMEGAGQNCCDSLSLSLSLISSISDRGWAAVGIACCEDN